MRESVNTINKPRKKPEEALRWNLQLASREFGTNRETLERRRRAQSIEPGEDGCYSTAQIVAMVFGQTKVEADTQLAITRKAEIELGMEVTRKERLPILDHREILSTAFSNVRGIIMASRLEDQAKDDILTELREAALV